MDQAALVTSMKWLAAFAIFSYLLMFGLVFNGSGDSDGLARSNRLGSLMSRSLIALGFAGSTAYWLWSIERNDMWRHGAPPVHYLLTLYGPYLIGYAAVGWLIATFIVPSRTRA